MTSIGKFVNRIKLEPVRRFPEIELTYLGKPKPTRFEVLGYLTLPKSETPATPYSLGKAVGVDSGFTRCQAVEFLNEYSDKEWDRKMLLEPYPVTMSIAQNHPSIFDERKGTFALTNTVALRDKGKLGLDMPTIEDGKVKIFLDGKAEVEAEDIGENVSYLDENIYPASKGTKVNRPTYSWRSNLDKASVDVDFWDGGDANVYSYAALSYLGSDARLPIAKIR
jgi:hypothetical protein